MVKKVLESNLKTEHLVSKMGKKQSKSPHTVCLNKNKSQFLSFKEQWEKMGTTFLFVASILTTEKSLEFH